MASPGRFFAANQLKLLLAAIVTKYDIEPIAERPPNPWLNNSIGPPIWSKLRVRRRHDANVDVSVRVDSPLLEALDVPEPVPLPQWKSNISLPKDSTIGSTLLDSKVLLSLAGKHELPAPLKVQS